MMRVNAVAHGLSALMYQYPFFQGYSLLDQSKLRLTFLTDTGRGFVDVKVEGLTEEEVLDLAESVLEHCPYTRLAEERRVSSWD